MMVITLRDRTASPPVAFLANCLAVHQQPLGKERCAPTTTSQRLTSSAAFDSETFSATVRSRRLIQCPQAEHGRFDPRLAKPIGRHQELAIQVVERRLPAWAMTSFDSRRCELIAAAPPTPPIRETSTVAPFASAASPPKRTESCHS
jgi:hypothetical protein